MTTLTKDHNNHPAHSQLTSRRLHQMRDILSKAAAQRDGGDIGYAMSDAVKLIDEAITAFDAQPVGYFYADKPGDWYQISDGDRVPSHRRIPLYASRQSSPVVKLPNEFTSSEGIVVQIEKVMAVLAVSGIQYERKGNSCRAAMLQAGNSPVIPDGLSTVCAEAYQVIGVMAEALDVFDDAAVQKALDNLSQQKLVHSDVLPFSLPAAPKQEVKP